MFLPLESWTVALAAFSARTRNALAVPAAHEDVINPERPTAGTAAVPVTAPSGKTDSAGSSIVAWLPGADRNGKFRSPRKGRGGGSPVFPPNLPSHSP